MGVLKKDAKNKEKDLDKERKKRGTRKYGQAKLKHSRMGVYSLAFSAGALVLLGGCILTAYAMRGETYSFIGGLGILSVLLAGLGIRAGVRGMREREKRYITCRAGIAFNGIILLALVVIFLGGL